MASTSLEIVISANDRFSATADRVIGKLHGIGSASKQVGKGVGELGVGLARVGVAGFTALAVGIGAAAKAGVDFEDAFAGVRKTVGGSKVDLDAMYESLRKLATRVPVKFTDLASIATEAGALGVPAKEIVHFTEVIARLSAATQGLTVEAASEAIGKLGNILHIHGTNIDRFASSLVALGNAGASTEADIIETAKRFGAAGSAAKLTASQVLGFASAIASLGVEPEAAGSALSRIFNKITLYIGTGNDKLKQFANTAHLSEGAFTALFKKDSTEGLLAFLKGLGQLDRFQVAKVLKNAGISNIRDVNAILLLSQNYGLLTDQLGVSSKAFKENTALTEASEARFGTLKSKLQVLKNNVLDAGASIAEGLNPAIGRLADKLTKFVGAHKGDFVTFGKDVGKFIDEIDWSKVQKGAETFVTMMKTLLGIIKQIPPEVDAAVVGFLGLNKISGGLIGKGLGDIAGGATSLVARGIGSLLPGKLGGLVGALGAQPVFVTNWPLGGVGGVGGGTNVVGGNSGILGKIFAVSVAAAIVEAAVPIGQAFASVLPDWLKGPGGAGKTDSQLASEFHHAHDNPGPPLANPILDRGGRERGAPGRGDRLKDDIVNLTQLQRSVWALFKSDLMRLRGANKPADMQAAAKAIVDRVVTKGAGSLSSTAAAIHELKQALSRTHDPKTAAILRQAIHDVSAKLPGRQFAAQELRKADQILNSNKDSGHKLADLKKIQHDLLARGLPHAAAQIGTKIDTARRAQVEAIKDKDLSVTIPITLNTRVSVRESIKTQTTYKKIGGVYIG